MPQASVNRGAAVLCPSTENSTGSERFPNFDRNLLLTIPIASEQLEATNGFFEVQASATYEQSASQLSETKGERSPTEEYFHLMDWKV